jgi:tRNA pseudouridine38-40 synthase
MPICSISPRKAGRGLCREGAGPADERRLISVARGEMRNIKMVIEYDGTAYCGWQRQTNAVTIQQVLEEAVRTMTREERLFVIGSGRTDAGVHALAQAVNFRTAARIPVESFLRGLNSLLPADIAVKELAEVHASFHARYDVKSKVYCYQIWNQAVRAPLLLNYSWFVRPHLSLDRMTEALAHFRGTHDFSSFCAAGDASTNHRRTVLAACIEEKRPGMVRITVEADGFLRHMVRNIVGTLVEVGQGRREAADVPRLIACRDRARAGVTAPPQGLFLKEVIY